MSPYRLARLAVLARRCKLVRLMRRGRWKTYGIALALGLMAGQFIAVATQPKAPITLLEAREVDGVAAVGRRIDLYFRIVKRAECNARVTRWLWQWTELEGRKVRRNIALTEGANPPTHLGVSDDYILGIPIPADVLPGDWNYQSQTFDGCAWGSRLFGETIRTSPSIPVRIEAPSPLDPPAVIPAAGPVTVVPTGGAK